MAVDEGAMMDFRILGPLEVLENGTPLELGARKHRELLAMLLIHANEVVSIDRLIDALWEEEPPREGAEGAPGLRLAAAQDPGQRARGDRPARVPATVSPTASWTSTVSGRAGGGKARRSALPLARRAAGRCRLQPLRPGGDRPPGGAPADGGRRSNVDSTSLPVATHSSWASWRRSLPSILCASVCADS